MTKDDENDVDKLAVGLGCENSPSSVGSGESSEVSALSTLSLAYPSCIRSLRRFKPRCFGEELR